MIIHFKRCFRFNFDTSKVEIVPISNEKDDFNSYLDELVHDIVMDKRSKKYMFPAEDTAVKKEISDALGGDIDGATMAAAKRLLKIEKKTQDKIERLEREIQKGILLQALVEHNDTKIYIIAKAEHLDFLNEEDNKKAKGLPIKKKVFKSFCGYLNTDDEPDYAMVGDSKTQISTYWWSDFLELAEEHSDTYNTQVSFDALEKKVFNKIKKTSPSDALCLRNATIQYFRANKEFVLEDYVRAIWVNYQPENPALNMEKFSQIVLELPEKEDFDSRFKLRPEELKKRIVTKVRLTAELSLEIRDNINWDNEVVAFTEMGEKYIKIKTDNGYDHFKKITQ
ncbi:nucleoid-associated protein [Chitinophaga arvensicola]|uniref:Nucleoid associated protein NdpA n=1 Tax=Chitinophaga arvensicola TaxID=29529 RepID=A0A1I0QJL6_9BACT|nr:hypothetical protein [Chitinophaga arvensicola]SEW27385.1 hypothetical protein SAMN04488122_1522 [Chitinophaga arvensicola]